MIPLYRTCGITLKRRMPFVASARCFASSHNAMNNNDDLFRTLEMKHSSKTDTNSIEPIAIPKYKLDENILKNGEDLVLQNTYINYTISIMTRHGEKAHAQKVFQDALAYVRLKTGYNPVHCFLTALLALEPLVAVKQARKFGKAVTIPRALTEKQKRRYAVEWFLEVSQGKRGQGKRTPIGQRMGQEILKILDGSSAALTKRKDMLQSAISSRANMGSNF